MEKRAQILSIPLGEFSQRECALGTSTQIKKQNLTSTPKAPLIPLPSHRPTPQG